jgi:hypothetical protein
MNFFISIVTIKKYKDALDILINSLPTEWKNKYILVYQNESENTFKIFEDNHIEVYITNNIYEYGNYIGINLLLEANIIPKNSWFLFLHDTCKFLDDNCIDLTYNLINEYNNSDIDILWLCNTGQCNICLIRKNGIVIGNNLYKDMQNLNKMDGIHYEWNHSHYLSPKSFNVKQFFINIPVKHLGKRYVYNNINNRDVLLYETINMEKYYYDLNGGLSHPENP